ncbi:GroES-like protein [Roridomyces roridus]|uniref:GroES-like protein n=1 Tax=Roridomyces roridus TaxID=1738132 RepID=A0AAD7C9Y5_9AGAR|nr:GroES-like protein [Roridomyces roridus]
MSEQKALLLSQKQAPFTVGTLPIPKPGPGEILIKVEAVALNPADWKMQKTGTFIDKYPAVLGCDVAGIAHDLGEGVKGKFEKGERQYTLVSADFAGRIPSHIGFAEAASIPAGFTSAAVGLLAAQPAGAGLNPTFDPKVKFCGQPAFVFGGSSCLGQFAIQILRTLQHSPIITYASAKHTEFLKSLGATHVIDRGSVPTSGVPDAVKLIIGDSDTPLKIAYDAISEVDTQDACFALVQQGGIVVSVLPSTEDRSTEGKTLIRIRGVPQLHPEFGRRMWEKLPKLVEQGVIVPNRVERLPDGLAGVVGGLKRLENNTVSGVKLVAFPQETV